MLVEVSFWLYLSFLVPVYGSPKICTNSFWIFPL